MTRERAVGERSSTEQNGNSVLTDFAATRYANITFEGCAARQLVSSSACSLWFSAVACRMQCHFGHGEVSSLSHLLNG